jgi:hypothetical protein
LAVLSNRLVTTNGSLASISALPEKAMDVLVDSGATNHVTSNRSLFVSMASTNVHLRVASKKCLPVVGVGDVSIPTPTGPLRLSKVLYCPQVAGTVLSVGFFNQWDSHVSFSRGSFVFSQNRLRFPSYVTNYRWFISVSLPVPSSASFSFSLSSLSPSVSALSAKLWHSC